MKRLLSLFLLIPLFSFANGDQPQKSYLRPKPIGEKFYIQPTQIGFSNNKIYVNFDGDWQSVKAIFADKERIYIMPQYSPWKCKECSVINEFFRAKCKTEDCTGKRPPKFTIPKPPRPPFPGIPHPREN